MIPYFWGGVPIQGASGLTFSELFEDDLGLDLPEEVQAAIEERQDWHYELQNYHHTGEDPSLRL